MSEATSEPAEKLLSLAAVRDRTGLGRTTIYRLVAAGAFPMQLQILPGRIAWLDSEVSAWIASRPRVNADRPRTVGKSHLEVNRVSERASDRRR